MTSAGIGTLFDSAATQYAEVSPLLWDRIGEATVTAAGIRAGERVLDVCCGAGASAIPAATAAGGRLVITAWAQGAMEGFGRLFAEAVTLVREAPTAPPSSKQAASRLDPEEGLGAWLTARGRGVRR